MSPISHTPDLQMNSTCGEHTQTGLQQHTLINDWLHTSHQQINTLIVIIAHTVWRAILV